jgi:hypothetical protein
VTANRRLIEKETAVSRQRVGHGMWSPVPTSCIANLGCPPDVDSRRRSNVSSSRTPGYWGTFVRQGVPSDKTDAAWQIFNAAGQLKSLQENDRSFVLSTEQFKREHDCKFWDENEQ